MKIQKCEKCHQNVMIYRHSIRKSLLKTMLTLYQKKGFEGAKLIELRCFGGDFAKLRFWGLVEAVPKNRWRLTGKGFAFLSGQNSIPKYIWIFDNCQVPQPEKDQIRNYQIWAKDILGADWEFMSKEQALMNAMPLNTKQLSLSF